MLHSMTAFAHVESRDDRGGVEWEIRSVNNRYLDVYVRLPEDLRGLDPKVRERVGARLGRGKVDCTLRTLPGLDTSGGLPIDRDLAARVAQAARAVAEWLPEPAPVNPVDVLRWPGVVQAPAPDPERTGHAALELAGPRPRRARRDARARGRTHRGGDPGTARRTGGGGAPPARDAARHRAGVR